MNKLVCKNINAFLFYSIFNEFSEVSNYNALEFLLMALNFLFEFT